MSCLINFFVNGFETLCRASRRSYTTGNDAVDKYREEINNYHTQSDTERLKGDFMQIAIDMRNGFNKVAVNGKATDK